MTAPISWDGLGFPGAMPNAESTSAALRRTQEAFAASQADLTRALADGDRIAARLMDTTVERDAACNLAVTLLREIDLARAELATARAELETGRIQLAATIEFASAYQEGNRGWQVARSGEHPCALCPDPIVRGQAVEPTPSAHGWFQHVHCPDRKPS